MGSKERSEQTRKSAYGQDKTKKRKTATSPNKPTRQAEVLNNGNDNAKKETTTVPPKEDSGTTAENAPIYVKSLENITKNAYIKDIPDDTYEGPSASHLLSEIQTRYDVDILSSTERIWGQSISLAWDHNRLWGRFKVGYFRGIMLIDPGPGRNYIKDLRWPDRVSSPRHSYFRWRGTSSRVPNRIFNSVLTEGEIHFGDGFISGHFGSMHALDSSSSFHGKPLPSVSRPMPCSIQSFIDEWNSYADCEDPESVRLPPEPKLILPRLPGKPRNAKSKSKSKPEWGRDQQVRFLKSLTGVFNAKSITIKNNSPSTPRSLIVRFHVDHWRRCIWGKFLFGVCEGFMLLQRSSPQVKPGQTIRFHWRGRETETGTAIDGFGEVRFQPFGHKFEGYFHDLYGNVDFSGFRRFPRDLNGDGSGYDTRYYRRSWNEYGSGLMEGEGPKKILPEPEPLPITPKKRPISPDSVLIPNPMLRNPTYVDTPALPAPLFSSKINYTHS